MYLPLSIKEEGGSSNCLPVHITLFAYNMLFKNVVHLIWHLVFFDGSALAFRVSYLDLQYIISVESILTDPWLIFG